MVIGRLRLEDDALFYNDMAEDLRKSHLSVWNLSKTNLIHSKLFDRQSLSIPNGSSVKETTTAIADALSFTTIFHSAFRAFYWPAVVDLIDQSPINTTIIRADISSIVGLNSLHRLQKFQTVQYQPLHPILLPVTSFLSLWRWLALCFIKHGVFHLCFCGRPAFIRWHHRWHHPHHRWHHLR